MVKRVETTNLAEPKPDVFIEKIKDHLQEKGYTVTQTISICKVSEPSGLLRQLELIWDGQSHPNGYSALVIPYFDEHRNIETHQLVLLHNYQLVHFSKKALEFLDLPENA